MGFESSQKRLLLEAVAVICTAAGKFVFMDYLNWRFVYVAFAVAAWTVYILYRIKNEHGQAASWGFRSDNFKKVLQMVIPFGLLAIGIFFGVGSVLGTVNLSWHILPILITYPLWGVIQQFLVIGLVGGNLQQIARSKIQRLSFILATAVLFSVVHYPSGWLMLGTFVLAIFYGFVYLKERNLYVLGLFHGWLGALFYYTVVGSDPFAEIFPIWA